ncbi:hypothetical protein [Paenibacillus timonensis]|uniref:hypothetical protein n=1 Tax=Paenibacillus timonensis TaxID=225915 RepID=UPI003F9C7807
MKKSALTAWLNMVLLGITGYVWGKHLFCEIRGRGAFFAFAVYVSYSFVAEILRRRQVDANRIFKQFGEEG